jgi:hypothetical protein
MRVTTGRDEKLASGRPSFAAPRHDAPVALIVAQRWSKIRQ